MRLLESGEWQLAGACKRGIVVARHSVPEEVYD